MYNSNRLTAVKGFILSHSCKQAGRQRESNMEIVPTSVKICVKGEPFGDQSVSQLVIWRQWNKRQRDLLRRKTFCHCIHTAELAERKAWGPNGFRGGPDAHTQSHRFGARYCPQ